MPGIIGYGHVEFSGYLDILHTLGINRHPSGRRLFGRPRTIIPLGFGKQ